MADVREIWLGDEAQHAIPLMRRTRMVVPIANPAIRFLRGSDFHGPGLPGAAPVETRVISAIDKKVLGWMAKHGDRPESANVLAVEVDEPAVTRLDLVIATPAGEQVVALSRSGVPWTAPTRFVLMYGDNAHLAGAKFDGITLLDVSASGDVPFEPRLEFRAGGHRRELGVIDVLLKGEEGGFRTARGGVFLGRVPEIKLVAPRVGPNFLQVILDDGDDSTLDEADITKLVNPSGDVTDAAGIPELVATGSAEVTGEWQPGAVRSRVHPQPSGSAEVAVFLIGGNRMRIHDTRDGALLYEAGFLLYSKKDETVPLGAAVPDDEIVLDDQTLRVGRGILTLDFVDSTPDEDIGRYLYALGMWPRGFLKEAGFVQAGTYDNADGRALARRLERIRGFGDSLLASAGWDVRIIPDESPAIGLEALPRSFRDATAEFGIGTGGFNNAEPHYFHHFYVHTFPAHRLIDKIRFPDADPPAITLSGAHFDLDKTFVLPTAKDEARGIVQAKKDHADRKIAIFGHTDASGSDSYNNELSRRRGRTAFALLTGDVDEWMKRLDNSPVSNERPWGTREVQSMLNCLDLYAGAIDGIKGEGTRKAIRDFQGRPGNGPVTGNDDQATRRKLVEAYMKEMTGTALAAGDFFADASGKPAIFGCGEAFPLVTTPGVNAQNRRTMFVLRRKPGAEPVDTSLEAASVPLEAWLSQETSDDDPLPPFVIGCGDSGFGLNDDFRGDHAKEPNRWFVQGRRIARPTDINATAAVNTIVFEDGDLRSISDSAGTMHGSAVMTSMCCDGEGNDDATTADTRVASRVVLGTGRNSRIRPLRCAFDQGSLFRKYEVLTADPEAIVCTSSLSMQNVFNLVVSGGVGMTPAQRTTLLNKMKAMLDSGKILFSAACNRNGASFPNERDVARTEAGFQAPDRSVTRGSFTGAQAFRARIVPVGATNHVTTAGDPEIPSNFTYLGTEVSLAFPGTDIRVVSSAIPAGAAPAGQVVVNGVLLRPINGTSFSTPMTAGVAAEMMLVNPALQQSANHVKLIEMLEATADVLPSLAAAPAAQQGPFLPGAANADPQLTAADLAGFRRVHFWKAVLAAANDGIPTESKLANGNAATTHFTLLTARDHAATIWYGFEIRTRVQDANLWLKKSDGSQVRLEDTGAGLPDSRTFGSAWRLSQPLRAPSTHANAGFRGFVLPAFPFAGTGLFMCQFSMQKAELDKFAELRLYPPGVDPVQQFHGDLPPVCVLDLGKIARMRDPAAITGAERTADAALDQIATHVEEFDDFVFHVTVIPQVLTAFAFLHPAASAVGEEFDAKVFAVDKFGNLKSDFNGNINVFHTGTAGAAGAGGGSPTGVFFGANPAVAPIPVAIANGTATFKATAHTAETFRFTADNGGGITERAGARVEVALPGPMASLRLEVAHDDGSDPATQPPSVDNKLKFTVTALDDAGRTKTDFRGTVELSVVEGERGFDAPAGNQPEKGGVQVADAIMDPFDAAKFRHTFVAGDNGKFAFPVFNYTAGKLVLEASDGTVSGRSRQIESKGGALDHFKLEHPERATLGSAFSLAVTCKDAFENTIEDFEDRVRVTVAKGTAPSVDAAGQKLGVHIGDSSTTADDFHEFEPGDHGVFNFHVTPHTAETIQLTVASDGGPSTNTADIAVEGAGALASFGIEVFGSQMTGVRFRLKVKALDANGRVITTFTGAVNAALVAGTAFAAAGPSGVQVHTASHTYAAADNGEFSFEVTAFTAEVIRMSFSSGATSTTSAGVTVQ